MWGGLTRGNPEEKGLRHAAAWASESAGGLLWEWS